MANPFAVRFREAAFTLEDTNIPEIAEMLHIASREIERLEAALLRAKQELAVWEHSCTGKHGSQMACHITPAIETCSPPSDAALDRGDEHG
jgi:hypothetical protein